MNHQILSKFAGLCVALCLTSNLSADDAVGSRLDTLEQTIAEQERALEQQRNELQRLRESIKAGNGEQTPEVTADKPAAAGSVPVRTRVEEIESTYLETARAAGPDPVGQAPVATREAPSSLLSLPADVPGVLSAQGKLTIEPSLQYSNSQLNRFTFRGIEIIDTFLLGIVEAEDSDRDLYTLSVTGRYGLTNRIELEMKIPYIWRDDVLNAIIPQIDPMTATERSLDGDGIGDIDLAMHYQINQGKNGWPFFIGNLRYKTTTGDGPFDIKRDGDGVEQELATGSGFHAIEPSVTVLYPTDPAVLFANVGYLINLSDDVDKTLNSVGSPVTVGEVDPGDALRISFGMAYAVNDKLSFTIGYKHDFIGKTETEVNGFKSKSADLSVGSLLLGYGYQLNSKVGINVNVEVGATDDAPDASISLRVPFVM
jgi:hypothetical protein